MYDSYTLTKSDYQLFLESPMHLWAHKHGQIQKQPTEFEIHIMRQGYEVEELDRDYLKEFVVNPKKRESIQSQSKLVNKELSASHGTGFKLFRYGNRKG